MASEFFLYSRGNYPVQYAPLNVSGNGSNTVVAAVSGRQIVVLAYNYVATSAVAVTWQSSGGSALDGPCAVAANGGKSVPYCPVGHFQTLVGEGLVMSLGSGVQVGGSLVYIVV